MPSSARWGLVVAIYADKKDGKPTGRWRVEVQIGGRRARGRFDSYEEAKKVEAQWLKGIPETAVAREDTRGIPKRLRDLQTRASDLWKGKDSREIAEARLARMVSLCGPETPVDGLETSTLDEVVKRLGDEGLGHSTINKYLSSLHRLLSWGKDRRWVSNIPVFPWLDEDNGRIRWITAAEEPRLLSLLSPEVAVLTRVAMATGMRRGELLSLEKQQVEPHWIRLWKTKTKVPRSVPIGKRTYQDVLWLLDNRMPTVHSIRYQWQVAKISMNLVGDEWFTFHVTRHTCATRLVQANVNLRLIQQWLGHKRIETTIRYAQVSDSMLQDALARQEVFLGGVLDTSPTVGYTTAPNIAGASASNLRGIWTAGNGPLITAKVAKPPETCAGVVKLADTQDLGSCGADNSHKDLDE